MEPSPKSPRKVKKPKNVIKSKKTVSEPINLNIKKSTNKRKRKNKTKITASEPKQMKLISNVEQEQDVIKLSVKKESTKPNSSVIKAEEKYPLLKDEELIKKFRAVPITNNQKGRIRLLLKDNLKGTSDSLLPDIIHNRIQSILSSNDNLQDTDLRKIRILYNMLKTAAEADTSVKEKDKKPKLKTELKEKVVKEKVNEIGDETEKTKKKLDKVKGPKRYVVFVGNLPLGIDKDSIMNHFSELKSCIKDVRIPEPKEEAKSCIAYIELKDEPTYELALSKHHSMLGNKRINVLYTAQKKGKITKTEAKSKSAKLVAMQKSGQLIGSTPLNKKRSQRRAKMRKAKLAAERA